MRTLLPARDYNRWRYRARTYLRAGGYVVAPGVTAVRAALASGSALTHGAAESLTAALALCRCQEAALRAELAQLDATLRAAPRPVDAVQRLVTVPGIGPLTTTTLYAAIGDVRRFPQMQHPVTRRVDTIQLVVGKVIEIRCVLTGCTEVPMCVRVAIVAAAFGFLTCSSAAATDQENLAKAVDKYLSSFETPKKGVCVCISDSAFPFGRKRVGIIERTAQSDSSGSHVAVNCHVPGYDADGAIIPQIPVTCPDWVPLSK